jgi:FKBP-type peptidyl-prolyl cis-trans isomerase FkpA
LWSSAGLPSRSITYFVDDPESPLHESLANSAQGDSVSIIIRASMSGGIIRGAYELPPGDTLLTLNFRVLEKYDRDKAELLEKRTISAWFGKGSNAADLHDSHGIYWLSGGPVELNHVKTGEEVSVFCRGYFLDGRMVDPGDTMRFACGAPGQLIEGLNNVIRALRTGDTAKIILPSRLAFGERGSTNGIVPPCTPLLYQVVLIHK